MNLLIFPFRFTLIIIFFGILLVIVGIILRKKKNNDITLYKNILINIGLIIFSGMLFPLYEGLFNKISVGMWHSVFLFKITVVYISLFNLIGIIVLIIYSKKLYIALIIYGLFIVSTFPINIIINIIANILINNKIIFEYPNNITYIALIIENIISYIIVLVIIIGEDGKKNNGVRGNSA